MRPDDDVCRWAGRTGFFSVLLVALVAGCTGQGSASGGGADVRDFSDFSEFSLKREAGLGFCPLFDVVFEATIVRDEAGSYVANISSLSEGAAGSKNCLDWIGDEFVGGIFSSGGQEYECVVQMEMPEQVLTADQAAEVLDVFSAVVISNTESSFCQHGSMDPCLISSYTFDSFEVSGFPCGTPRMASGQAERIIDLLEALRAANPGEPVPVEFTISGRSYAFRLDEVGVFGLTADGQERTGAALVPIFTSVPADAPSAATLSLDARDVQLAGAEGSQTDSITIDVYIGPAGSVNPCEDGEQVGTFAVSYDGDSISLEAGELPLTGAALTEVSTGRFTMCLVASGDIDATLTIREMGIRFAAGTED
jgi:hypothetical protein